MNATLISKALQLQQWQDDYQDFLASGLSQHQWCDFHDLKQTTFSYRVRRLRQVNYDSSGVVEVPQTSIPVSFAKVETGLKDVVPASESTPCTFGSENHSGLCISLRNALIHIPPDAPESQIAAIVRALANA